MVPASGDAHKKFSFPPRGIRSRIDSSACGNAIKILHPRKRRFCNYFCAPSPRAEMHMKIYISPSREYYPAPTIPACGNATKILHLRERIFCNYFGSRSRLRKCTISCVSPRAEIRSGRRIFRFADMQADVCSTASGTARNSVIFNTWSETICCFPFHDFLLRSLGLQIWICTVDSQCKVSFNGTIFDPFLQPHLSTNWFIYLHFIYNCCLLCLLLWSLLYCEVVYIYFMLTNIQCNGKVPWPIWLILYWIVGHKILKKCRGTGCSFSVLSRRVQC